MRVATLVLAVCMTLGSITSRGDEKASPNQITHQIISEYIKGNYQAVSREDVRAIVQTTTILCNEHQVDPFLITAILSVESNFNRYAVSNVGARGLGQLMPFNWAPYGITDPHDIHQNLKGTVLMMKELLAFWHGDTTLALASYYQGIEATKRMVRRGVALPRYTLAYVASISRAYKIVARSAQASL